VQASKFEVKDSLEPPRRVPVRVQH
jgi:hypothetical protein